MGCKGSDVRIISPRPTITLAIQIFLMTYISFFLFVILWLIFSGVYEPLTLFFGLLSVFIVLVITSLMEMPITSIRKFRYEKFFIYYFPWLLKEIIVAAVKTSSCVLGLRKFKSGSKRIKSSNKSGLGSVIYANSITLTPGTLTIEVSGNDLIVHALCDDSIIELEDGEMDNKVVGLEQ